MTNTLSASPVRRLPLLRAIAACAFSLAAFAPAAAQSCNPLELLFGGCRQQPTAPVYVPVDDPTAFRRKAPARHLERKPVARTGGAAAAVASSNGVSGKQVAIKPAADAPAGSLALFSRDRTLRSGDIVVTKSGFLVYAGRSGAFTPIAHGAGALAALEKASMRGESSAFAGQTRAVSVPAPAPQPVEPQQTQAPVPAAPTPAAVSPSMASWLAVRQASAERLPVKTATIGFGG